MENTGRNMFWFRDELEAWCGVGCCCGVALQMSEPADGK